MRPYLKLRLTDDKVAWQAAKIIDIWKHTRQMSKHLPRAVLLYKALLDNDYDRFTDMLIEISPRIAIRLLQQLPAPSPPPPPPQLTREPKAKPKAPPPKPILLDDESAPSDSLAASLGLDDLDFGE